MGLVGRTRLKAGCQLGLGAASAGLQPAGWWVKTPLCRRQFRLPRAATSGAAEGRVGIPLLCSPVLSHSPDRGLQGCVARDPSPKPGRSRRAAPGRQEGKGIEMSRIPVVSWARPPVPVLTFSGGRARGEWRPSLSSGPRRGVIALSVRGESTWSHCCSG